MSLKKSGTRRKVEDSEEVLRAGGPDGPRLYCEDTLDAIVGTPLAAELDGLVLSAEI